MTDFELQKRVSESKEDGFRILFQQYQNYVYSIVWGKLQTVGTAEDAEECISDVFLQVFRHFDEIQTGSIKAYIGTVAKNLSTNYALKLQRNFVIHMDAQEEMQKIPSEENIVLQTEETFANRHLFELVKNLGEPDSTIVIQKYFYGRKSKDIAKLVNLSTVSVRVRLSRALKKLQQMLTDEESGRK